MNHFTLFYFISLFSSLFFYANGDKYTVVDTRYSKSKNSELYINSNRLDCSVLEDSNRRNQNSKVDNKVLFADMDTFEILRNERSKFVLYLCADEDQVALLNHFFGKLEMSEKFKNIRFNVLDLCTDEIDEVGLLRDSAERLFLSFYKERVFHEFESDFYNIDILMVINPTAQIDSESKFLLDNQALKGEGSLRWLQEQIGAEAVADSGIIFIINSNEKLRFIPISLKLNEGSLI